MQEHVSCKGTVCFLVIVVLAINHITFSSVSDQRTAWDPLWRESTTKCLMSPCRPSTWVAAIHSCHQMYTRLGYGRHAINNFTAKTCSYANSFAQNGNNRQAATVPGFSPDILHILRHMSAADVQNHHLKPKDTKLSLKKGRFVDGQTLLSHLGVRNKCLPMQFSSNYACCCNWF